MSNKNLTTKALHRLLSERPPLTVYDAEDDNTELPDTVLWEDLREGLEVDDVVFSDFDVTYLFSNGLYAVEEIDQADLIEELGL